MKSASAIIERINAFLPWSVPLKLLLSALLGVLGSAGLLGYLTEYATYNYAIHYGIRPPLEGIPYLRPAVAFGSLFLFFSGALLFAGFTALLQSVAWHVDGLPQYIFRLISRFFGPTYKMDDLGAFVSYSRQQATWKLAIVCAVAAALVIALKDDLYSQDVHIHMLGLSFKFFLNFSLFFAIVKPKSIWWSSIILVLVYFVTCVYLMFTPTNYSEFLRMLGYGGGLSVQIELRDQNKQDNMPITPLQLMLRTSEAVILYDKQQGKFIEIPRDQIYRISHNIGGMHNLPFLLPDKIDQFKKEGTTPLSKAD
jgi:hypothetical protein